VANPVLRYLTACCSVIWERQRATLHHIRATGEIPDGHASHDHLNEQNTVPVRQDIVDKWTSDFEQLAQEVRLSSARIRHRKRR